MSSTNRTLFGRVGLTALAVMFVIAVSFVNFSFRGLRLDLTENNLYTLSDGTEKLLGEIAEPINVYFFYSDRATANIPYLRNYAGRVREMLEEFVQYADGQLNLAIVDPIPFSEDEDRAAAFGLQSINLGGVADPIYLGIAATNSIGDEEIIPFLDPGKETFLEYDLAKLIYTLSRPDRPVVGLLSSLEITAGFDPQTQQMRQPWLVIQQIQQLFELRSLPAAATSIDEEIDVLMIVHPKDLSDQTLYAIDQFVLGGGRALIFVDPYAEFDLPAGGPQAAMMADRSSSLGPLLESWGLDVKPGEVVGDDRFALSVTGFGNQPIRHLALIGIDESGIDRDDVITAGLQNLNFGFAGHIVTKDEAAVSVLPLIQSSELAGTVPAANLSFMPDPEMLRDSFTPADDRLTIAARIEGEVASAFPDGNLAGDESSAHLAASQEPINVVLVADVDVLTDRLWAQVQNFFGQPLTTAFAANGDFVVNALDNLTGSGDLISIRGRSTYTRPFTLVQELRREAEERFRSTEQRLQQQLTETEARLSELQESRDDSSALILSDEQAAELERFQAERLRIRKELRQVQRELDQNIENLGGLLKAINIGLMPILISLMSLSLYFLRRRRKAA